jgi:polyvinyl alcohol dehydrogenase (cytochrome)
MKSRLLITTFITGLAAASAGKATAKDWPMFGQNLANTASSVSETTISIKNVARLKPKWVAATGGAVSARAAVVKGVVYFPDWGGNLWALNAMTGKAVWHREFSGFGLPAKTVSRTSPAVVNGVLYTGTQQGAALLAIDAATGKLKWKTELDSHPQATITGSPAVANGVVYLGVSSNEETAANSSTYKCCSFRGSVVAVDAATGKILWKSFTAPEGYNGAAVWGSNPIVDLKRKVVFIGTGNNYTKPTTAAYKSCIAGGGTEPKCLSPEDHVDSMLSLDLATGHIKWARRQRGDDDWNVSCFFKKPGIGNCPKAAGPDYDFGSAPNEFMINASSGPKAAVGAGQKAGIYSVFDADTGALMWAKQVGPGSTLGGMEWGSATDGRRIYVAISNYNRDKYKAGTAGSWSALNPVTGDIMWQVPDPNDQVDLSPMAVANGVVFAGSMAFAPGQDNMFALDAATGKILWKFASEGSVIAGAVISDGVVYWGSGYANFGSTFKDAKKFYAFSIDGK